MTGGTKSWSRESKDTRGLPFGLDPRMFYVYSAQKRSKSAKGLEGFLYKLIPYQYIGSFAFAIDPLSRFKLSATRITPTVRSRTNIGRSILDSRSYDYSKYTYIEPYPYLPNGSYSTTNTTTDQPDQLPLPFTSDDTTKSLRPPGSEMGEFSSWKVQTFSAPRSRFFWRHYETHYWSYPGGYWYRHGQMEQSNTRGASAYIKTSDVDAIKAETITRSNAIMQKDALWLYQRCNSQRRATTLFRNIVELRDIPRALLDLQHALRNLRELSASLNIPKSTLDRIHRSIGTVGVKDLPSQYLSYEFGWRQTYSDVLNLLLAPNRIAKRVNFLLRRNGKATTYRTSSKVHEVGTTNSGFRYTVLPGELTTTTEHLLSFDHELKMVISATFQFPDIDEPKLRKKEFIRQLGVVPTPIDLYNLVPWTWLVDWFTGFGNYLDIIQAINSDTNLVNWGLLTNITSGELRTTFTSKGINSEAHNGPIEYHNSIVSHSSVMKFSLHQRRDVSGLLSVNSAGDTSTLTSWQLSILGSILAGSLKIIT